MQEMRVESRGCEDSLEKKMATHSSILAREIPMDRGGLRSTFHEVTRVGHDLPIKPSPQPAIKTMY